MPEIIPAAFPYLRAWDDVQGQRHYGMSVGPLIRSEVRSYLIEEACLDRDELARHMEVISELDSYQMKLWNEKKDS